MKKILLIFPLVFLLSLLFVNANIDCNLSVPSTLGNLSVLNASFNTSAGTTGNVTVFFEGSSATTRNSSFSFFGNVSNTSNLRHTNFTIPDSVIAEDSNDWQFRATCYHNASGAEAGSVSSAISSTISSIILDRTKPAPPTGITFSNPVENGETITATINRGLANRCFIRFGSASNPRSAMILSGSGDSQTCTFTVGRNNPPNFDYQAFVSADDRLNETLSNAQSITIRAVPSSSGEQFEGFISTPSKSPFSKVDNKSIAVILILVLLFLYFKNKK